MTKQTKNIIITCIITYLIVYVFYLLTSVGLANKEIFLQMRRFIPCILSIAFILYISKIKVSQEPFYSSAIISLLWITVAPLTYYATYHNSYTFISNHFDMAFGLYIFFILSSIKFLLNSYFSKSKVIIFLFTILQFILISVPILIIFYFIFYQSVVNYNGILAIYQTNLPEAIEFIKSLPLRLSISFVLLLIVIFICLYRNNFYYQFKHISLPKKLHLSFLAILIIVTSYTFSNLLYKTYPISTFIDVKDYFTSITSYRDFHKNNFDKLTVINKNGLSKPHTIVLVIGESESKDLMHCYNENYGRNNTPWFTSQLTNDNFIFFDNAYACWVQTVPVLERALTEKNQYNDLEFNKSFSIIDIAKKAGYKTYWFSNQGFMGSADTPITLVGQSADIAKWTANEINMVQHDESLLQFIDDINPNENNFVVFHIMGSHANYESRYPSNRAIWGKENYTPLDGNDNSVAYTDYVLSQIYKIISTKTHLASMIYFSDHGSNPSRHRYPDKLDYYTLHIPLVIYLSDDYISTNPQIGATLTKNKHQYISNDLMYNLICSIINVESNHFNEKESIASDKYKYDKYTLKAMLGKMTLADDITKK